MRIHGTGTVALLWALTFAAGAACSSGGADSGSGGASAGGGGASASTGGAGAGTGTGGAGAGTGGAGAGSGGEGIGTGSGGAGTGSGGAGADGSGGAAELRWYLTCGDPVCSGHRPRAGVKPCTDEKEGAPCAAPDATCDPEDDCNALLLCTSDDPRQRPEGCPRSRARYKHDIRYLSETEIERVRDELVATPLTTWRYNHEGERGREHLGFIIDDNPASAAVASDGDHVDLYGYTSMAVAAIQTQQKQIAALEREVAALRKELDSTRQAARPPASTATKTAGRTTR
ncbi:tail fiber domain-containing protein [Sorangium sp. So ce1000]|uniref:tail fiber domain-containing protein n=1 Tax=Sorangium sp. So ce1000 TaxID=3133325 RepID=UPI003F5F932A